MIIKEKIEPADIRRQNLKTWLENRVIPRKEKSYFSQLSSGAASFGEKAARRLEIQYNMGICYLDKPLQSNNAEPKNHLADLLNNDPQKGIEEVLLNCFRSCNEEDRDLLLLLANKLYERAKPDDARANPNRRKSDYETIKNKKITQ